VEKSGVAEFAKLLIVFRVDATHRFDHFFTQFHRRWQRLWITTEDVTKVNVEQFARSRQHQIVQMSVANAQQIRNDAITGWVNDNDKRREKP
jgi:hypothetical protein